MEDLKRNALDSVKNVNSFQMSFYLLLAQGFKGCLCEALLSEYNL